MNKLNLSQNALAYHEKPVAGKIEVIPTKPCDTQEELSLAYTPGVAVPCLEIEKNPEDAYKYTGKGNLVAVLTNGTAVLGLGNIGALAGKPVMEGKGVLFKKFAGINVFDIELNSSDPQEIIKACKMLEPTFGGINLEDIKAPECFIIEEELKKSMNIPVFHDDQHGTAIIAGAALLNALEIVGKKIDRVKLVINGAGAAGLAIAGLLLKLGVKKENLTICDTKGVIYKGRSDGMNKYKEVFAVDTDKRTLTDAVKGCDVLYGLSRKGAFSEEMIKSMAKDPIIFAMANPDPEITPEEVKKIRTDAIMATGRSDYPNQINNVSCFPFLFRGALDVGAVAINEEMKIAASHALAMLAREPVPTSVCRVYGVSKLEFGRDYILPKPFDPRLLTWVSVEVAKAAMKSGVATKPIKDFEQYKIELETRLDPSKEFTARVIKKGKAKKAKIGFTWAAEINVLSAAVAVAERELGIPVLIGNEADIKAAAKSIGKDISKLTVIDPVKCKKTEKIIEDYYKEYWRYGVTKETAYEDIVNHPNRFGAALLNEGEIDCLVAYAVKNIEKVVQHVADFIDKAHSYHVFFSAVLKSKNREFIISDPVCTEDKDEDSLINLAEFAVFTARLYDITPKLAFIHDSNFGNPDTDESASIRLALEEFRLGNPKIVAEGDMRFDTAVDPSVAKNFPMSEIKGDANVLVFSSGKAAETCTKALTTFGGFKLSAKVLQGFSKPVQIAEKNMDAEDIITIAMIGAASVETKTKTKKK